MRVMSESDRLVRSRGRAPSTTLASTASIGAGDDGMADDDASIP